MGKRWNLNLNRHPYANTDASCPFTTQVLLNGNITADSLNFDTTQMYVRGQIHVPAALLGTSLTGGGVHPTAVLDTILPCHISILSTERRAVLHDTAVGTQQPEEGK